MLNAAADVARSTESPAAAASVCTTQPAVMPSVAATPARNPPAAPRAAMYAMSGPGVTLSSNPAAMNKAEVVDAHGGISARPAADAPASARTDAPSAARSVIRASQSRIAGYALQSTPISSSKKR